MISKFAPVILVSLIFSQAACKSSGAERKSTKAVSPEISATSTDRPSTHYQGDGGFIAPGSDEVLVSRGPNARCPTAQEIDALDKVIAALGQETVDLVNEDMTNLRQTRTKAGAEAVASCCNQLEQLVQDVEIMNEDKETAVAGIQLIRTTTLKLCPSNL